MLRPVEGTVTGADTLIKQSAPPQPADAYRRSRLHFSHSFPTWCPFFLFLFFMEFWVPFCFSDFFLKGPADFISLVI